MGVYLIKGQEYHVPTGVVHSGLAAYDIWLNAKKGSEITSKDRMRKVREIALSIHPRTPDDYYRPDRLERVLKSELGKRNRGRKRAKSPEQKAIAKDKKLGQGRLF
jgi:hypothetical protein